MPSTYSTHLLLELMADGENEGLWGDITNTNLEILGRAISGSTNVTLSGTTHTLTVSQASLSEGHYSVLVLGGSPTGTNTITINPNTVPRIYLVKNDSGQDAVFTQGSGGNATVVNGDIGILFSDGGGSSASVTDLTPGLTRNSENLSGLADAATALQNLGLTATASELNTLDGITASTTDLNKTTGIEAGADVTDTANVTAAGALMDSEVANLAQVKAFDSADYATAAQGTKADNAMPKAGGTFTGNVTFDETTETVYNLTGTDLDPANGTIQYKTLTANTTFTEALADGQSVTLRLAAGDTYTVTWFTVTWVGGSAPTLTADDVLVFWQEGATVYGKYIGSVA